MEEPFLALQGVTKYFGPVAANQDVNLEVHRGRVLALLGENGAGKSTLMSILAGRYKPDEGIILMDGQEVRFTSPAQALGKGIGMVYQRFMLIESMSVEENLRLAAQGKLGKADCTETILQTASRYSLEVDPQKKIYELSMGERQRVEIIKLLLLDANVLIFDEPTAVLTPPEVESLVKVIDKLRDDGKGVIFITHKLEEVLQLADDISIMRKGRLVISTSADNQQISRRQLARLMVGRDVVLQVDKEKIEQGEVILSLSNFSGRGRNGGAAFQEISFEVRQGEIFSIIGVAGNGQSELISALMGFSRAESGEIHFLGRGYGVKEWVKTEKKEIAYVPEDRYHTGSVGSMNIAENLGLTRLESYSSGFCGIVLDKQRMQLDATRAIEEYSIKAESYTDRAGSLSGGNLQKVILARELARKPKLFIAEQPTQGLDISATEEIWKAMLNCRRDAAVLLITGDLKEVLSLSDRIGVIFNGRLLEIIDAKDSEGIARVGMLMAGVTS